MIDQTHSPTARGVSRTRQLDLLDLPPVTVIVGHAGVGKTNCALALALAHAARSLAVTLADVDIVNPYFRSSDYAELLRGHGVRLIEPVFARTSLDTPSLTGELEVVAREAAADPTGRSRLIIDAGGDDDGAGALGRYAAPLHEAGAVVLYAVNAYRSLTQTPEQAASLVPGIEHHCHLQVSGVLNTTNLSDATTAEHVAHGRRFAARTAELLGLPLVATAVPEAAISQTPYGPDELAAQVADTSRAQALSPEIAATLNRQADPHEQLVLVPRVVRTPWDD